MIELIPESYVAPLDLPKIFGRIAPLHVDLGCAEGSFLIALAERHPEKNFLGIERQAGRVAKACRRAARSQAGDPSRSGDPRSPQRLFDRVGSTIGNIRILYLETSYAVRYLLPEKSVETFYLLFPDPWPKRRHQKRRVVSSDFLQSIHHALALNGVFRIATDQHDYFLQIRQQAIQMPFEETEVDGEPLPTTRFERIFQQKNDPIYRLSLRKISPVK